VQRAEKDLAAELVVARATADRRYQEMADLKMALREKAEEEARRAQQERDRINEEKATLLRQVRGLEGSLEAMKDAAARGDTTWSTLSHKNAFSNAPTSASPKFFDLSNFPMSPQSNALDAFSGEAAQRELRFGENAGDATLGGILASSHGGRQSENSSTQVSALQQRLSALEDERDALADELAVSVTQNDKALRNAESVPVLVKELEALGRQYQLTLELLGATEEEVDDMRMTLEEVRLIYRGELERLMDAIPKDHKWNVPAFPTTSRATPTKSSSAAEVGEGGDVKVI